MAIFKGKLTKHFSIEEYEINQTGTCYITLEALEHAEILEEFRVWLGKSMKVNAWYRTSAYNKKVGGNSNSSHLRGVATDISMPNVSQANFIKYAKKWKALCSKYGVVGEAGLYSWGIHFGSHIKYSKTFYHWDSRSGKQINKPFKI